MNKRKKTLWLGHEYTCARCGILFKSPAKPKAGIPKCCSYRCAALMRPKNYQVWTDEQRKARGIQTAARNKVRVWTDESRQKLATKASVRNKGANNPNYSAAFKEFNCQECSALFRVANNELKAGKHSGKYCSLNCRDKYLKRLKKPEAQTRLNRHFSRGINKALKGKKGGIKWPLLMGYTLDDLIAHLEALFQPGMTWDNYGRNGWHVDHKKPLSFFTYALPTDAQFLECWALDNLQPMWEYDNISKGGINNPKLIELHGLPSHVIMPRNNPFDRK